MSTVLLVKMGTFFALYGAKSIFFLYLCHKFGFFPQGFNLPNHMKKIAMQNLFRHILLAAFVTGTAGASASAPRFAHARTEAPHTEAAEAHWVPGSLTTFSRLENPDQYGNLWELDFVSTFTYDSKGNALVTDNIESAGANNRVTQTYDERGFFTSKITEVQIGSEWVVSEKVSRKFDEITGVEIEHRATSYDDNGNERPGNNFNRVITRDADGRVTRVEIQVLHNGTYDPIQRIYVTYNDEGTPSEIRATALNSFGKWEEAGRYSDIVWENTNCQITTLDGLFQGDNRIKSARFYQKNGSQEYFDYQVTATYTEGDTMGYTSVSTGLFQGIANAVRTIVYKVTDDNGSYHVMTRYGTTDSEEPDEIYDDTVKYDAYGNDVLVQTTYRTSEAGSRPSIEERQAASVTYDETYGYPLSMVVSIYDPETGKNDEILKVEYADYIDANTIEDVENSINAIGAAPAAGATLWFDLSGRRVSAPVKGIYIRRNGSVSTKVNI